MPKVTLKSFEVPPGEAIAAPEKGQVLGWYADPRPDKIGHALILMLVIDEAILTNAKVMTMPKTPGRG